MEGVKILVADDDRVSRFIICERLRGWGYSVVECEDGAEAHRILSDWASAPRIAILDWEMPGMTGPAICRAVRESHLQDAYTYMFLLTSRSGATTS
jgi:CheY-like chemotaxis protein